VAEGQDQEIEEVGYTRAANLTAKSKPASITHDGLEDKLDGALAKKYVTTDSQVHRSDVWGYGVNMCCSFRVHTCTAGRPATLAII
jgi:hypothetical protein